jgi:amino acid permease
LQGEEISFLVNSISLTDFIADGLNLYKNNKKTWLVYLIAYLPALCTVLFYPRAFLMGLSVAGTLAIIQLLILPCFIVWVLRYQNKNSQPSYSVVGGKPVLVLVLGVSFILLILSILN